LTFWGRMPDMAQTTFDDPVLVAALIAYVDAVSALEQASDDSEVLRLSDAKSLTGMLLRKRLLELGWAAPVAQRTTT
jgi:hypothetical protein